MSEPLIRPIRAADDAAVAAIIQDVMASFGATGPEYSSSDPEVHAMSAAYDGARSACFVLVDDGRVLGCGGIAPLAGGDPDVCELRKMYLLPEARGRGLGKRMLHHCLEAARARLPALPSRDTLQHGYRTAALCQDRIHPARRAAGHGGSQRLQPALPARTLISAEQRSSDRSSPPARRAAASRP